MNSFGSIIKKSREEANIPLRKVAAFLDIDQAVLSKIERGQRKPKRELVEKLAEFFNTNKEKLLIAWLSDKVLYEVQDDDLALKALHAAEDQVLYRAAEKSERSQTISKLKSVMRAFSQIDRAWIFGSFARADDGPKSDIDVLIDVPQEIKFTLFDIAEIREQLEKAVGKKVDVVMLNGIRPALKKSIENEMQLIYEAG
ncbi:MAG: nucleotidyltransferase domain-containing protein [Imperialibacter sp.]|uniref:nucleotidyltransferase domain-containing protein n=1 Tax=Imperialibacter sp. TaxID=2038411 RepID=UPI0032EBFC01